MRFLAIFFFLLMIVPAIAVTPETPDLYAVAKILSGNEIALADQRILHLEGIEEPLKETPIWRDKARQALQELTEGRKLELGDISTDRYGRVAAQAYVLDAKDGKIWLQGEMLKRGLAFVYLPSGEEARLDEMRTLEAAAWRAKAGIWADDTYADTPANKAYVKEGRFAFVSGLVLDAARVKNMVYLNFGPNWRTDFTVAIAAHDLRLFRKAGIDPLTLKGKTIRARGWIKRDFGPMITITNPGQIEIMLD